MPNIRLLGIRLLAIWLLGISLQNAWAGLWQYQGRMAFEEKEYARAARFFEKAMGGNALQPDILYENGVNAFSAAEAFGSKTWYEAAQTSFERLTALTPYYGRAWLYLGMSRLMIEEKSVDGVTASEWEDIKKMFYAALEKEPGSAWVAFNSGVFFLKQDRYLSGEEKQMAMDQIKRAVLLDPPRRLGKSPRYLKTALSFLWNQYGDFSLLTYVTPPDAPSYRRLLEFIDHHHLAIHRAEVSEAYLELKEATQNV